MVADTQQVEQLTKQCSACKAVLDVNLFSKSSEYGYQSRCKSCSSAMNRVWYDNTDYFVGYRMRKFGEDRELYDRLLKEQEGKCAICGCEPKRIGRRRKLMLCIDHDHKTGRVRSLLCHACNSALGLFRDSSELLRKAADYLERYAC
jgi:hypothetical protein